eukprot:9488552-Pyramimonas_sp.AAC.1
MEDLGPTWIAKVQSRRFETDGEPNLGQPSKKLECLPWAHGGRHAKPQENRLEAPQPVRDRDEPRPSPPAHCDPASPPQVPPGGRMECAARV